MKNLNTILNEYTHYFNGSKTNNISCTGTIYQGSCGTESIIMGIDTLRCTYFDSDKNASISFSPATISVGSFEMKPELKISVFDSDLHNTYSRLHIDGGELFQLSTVHDFDFMCIPILYTKYLELLKVVKLSERYKNDSTFLDDAIANLTEVCNQYSSEA